MKKCLRKKILLLIAIVCCSAQNAYTAGIMQRGVAGIKWLGKTAMEYPIATGMLGIIGNSFLRTRLIADARHTLIGLMGLDSFIKLKRQVQQGETGVKDALSKILYLGSGAFISYILIDFAMRRYKWIERFLVGNGIIGKWHALLLTIGLVLISDYFSSMQAVQPTEPSPGYEDPMQGGQGGAQELFVGQPPLAEQAEKDPQYPTVVETEWQARVRIQQQHLSSLIKDDVIGVIENRITEGGQEFSLQQLQQIETTLRRVLLAAANKQGIDLQQDALEGALDAAMQAVGSAMEVVKQLKQKETAIKALFLQADKALIGEFEWQQQHIEEEQNLPYGNFDPGIVPGGVNQLKTIEIIRHINREIEVYDAMQREFIETSHVLYDSPVIQAVKNYLHERIATFEIALLIMVPAIKWKKYFDRLFTGQDVDALYMENEWQVMQPQMQLFSNLITKLKQELLDKAKDVGSTTAIVAYVLYQLITETISYKLLEKCKEWEQLVNDRNQRLRIRSQDHQRIHDVRTLIWGSKQQLFNLIQQKLDEFGITESPAQIVIGL